MVKNFDKYFKKSDSSLILEGTNNDDIKVNDLVVVTSTQGLSEPQIKFLNSNPFFVVKDIKEKDGEIKLELGYRVPFSVKHFEKISGDKNFQDENKYPIPEETVDPITGEIKQIDFKSLPKIREFSLFLSPKLINVLKEFQSPLAKSLIANNGKLPSLHTFLDYDPNTDRNKPKFTCIAAGKLAYLSAKEEINLNDTEFLKSDKNPLWNISARVEIGIGSLLGDLFGDFFTANHIEEFTNEYKTSLSKKDVFGDFKMVEGEKIKTIYRNEGFKIHTMSGTLKKSCLIGKSSDYLTLYTENKDKVCLLCLMDPDNPGMILGRAILWKNLRKPKDKWFMDRVYTVKDDYTNIFIKYAKFNGWLYKREQNFYTVDEFMDGNKLYKDVGISIVIKPGKYRYYPYMDTLKFYTPETGRLGSLPGNNIGFEVLILQNPNGGVSGQFDFKNTYKDFIRRP